MRILMSMRDPFPPQRPDVKALFGRYLPLRGMRTDLLAETTASTVPHDSWPAGAAHVFQAGGRSRFFRLIGAAWFYCIGMAAHSRGVAAIQVRDQLFLSLIGLACARWRGVKFFYWMSFPFPEGYLELARSESLSTSPLRRLASYVRGRLGEKLVYGFLTPRADHVFVQSERMLEVMAARGVRRDRMTAVPMGVDMASVRAASITPVSDHRLSGRRPLIYLGALDRARRIDFLLHVLAQVQADFPKVVLILAGNANEPGDMDWLQQEARRIGVSGSVVWLGWLPMEQAWRYVKRAEIGLSPIPPGPLYDVSSPTKALEYMALGIPVVGNRIPDQEKVLRESGAGLAVDYDTAAFAKAIAALLLEPNLAQAMGRRGPEYIGRERDYAVIAERVAAVYRTLLVAEPPLGTGDTAAPTAGCS